MSDGLNIPLNINSKTAFDKFEKDAKRSGDKAASSISSGIGGSLQIAVGFIGAKIATEGLRILTGAFKDSIAAANRQEDAVNLLNSSLKRSGEFTREVSNDLQNFAAEIENTTTFSDEATIEQLAFAKSLGLTSDQSKDVVKAATNLSAALGISLESATRNIAKTFSGLQGELGELLPSLRGLTKEQLQAGAATALINKEFAGSAISRVETTRGAYDQFSNAVGSVSEAFGQLITKSDAVQSTLTSTTTLLRELAKTIDPDPIKEAGDNISFLKFQLEGIIATRGRSSKAARDQIALIEKEKDALRGLIIDRKAQEDRLAVIEEQARKDRSAAAEKARIDESNKRISELQNIGLTESQILELNLIKEQQQLADAYEGRLGLEEEFLARSFELRRKFEEAEAALKTSSNPLAEQAIQFDDFFNQVGAGFEGFASTVKLTGGQIAATIGNGLGRAVSSGFNAFGAALAKGENAIAAFGAAALNAIGQTISQLGQMFILKGIAYSLDPLSGGPAVGGPLIAAGAALATFGGFLSAFSGGSGGAGASSFNNDPNSSVFEQQPQQIAQEERQDPQTAVTVNIQGDVLDSEQSSLRIAELLQKAVSDQGVRFA